MGRKPAILAVDMMLRRHSSAGHYGMHAGRQTQLASCYYLYRSSAGRYPFPNRVMTRIRAAGPRWAAIPIWLVQLVWQGTDTEPEEALKGCRTSLLGAQKVGLVGASYNDECTQCPSAQHDSQAFVSHAIQPALPFQKGTAAMHMCFHFEDPA